MSDEDLLQIQRTLDERGTLSWLDSIRLLDEVQRLKEILAIKSAAREMASAAYRDAESDLAKAVEALGIIAGNCKDRWFAYRDGDRFGGFYPGQIARAVLEELGK